MTTTFMFNSLEDNARRFIETEPIGQGGENAERKVWEAIKMAFSQRNCIGYWRYPLFSKIGETRKEPDIVVVDRQLHIVIIEVKGFTIDQILSIEGHRWNFANSYQSSGNPYQQAENQLYSLLTYPDREESIRRQVQGKALVALPLITEAEWRNKGFDQQPNCPPIIFKDHLTPKALFKIIDLTPSLQSGRELSEKQWENLLSVLGGMSINRKTTLLKDYSPTDHTPSGYTPRSAVIQQLNERLHSLDLQQTHIGMEVPPGPQRIRGIAGSGKTVLLCRKAVQMHLKHPDWDIALVFFTRSIYDQIEFLVDKWMKHSSNGEVSYSNNPKAKTKLRILHAWGAQDRQGFYRAICEHHGTKPQGVIPGCPPVEGLATNCALLMKNVQIQPMFDAVLIDEGQDLIVDKQTCLYQDKQAIYWLAYQSLRPVDLQDPINRRLVWAYDEAQSLHTKKIPTSSILFGGSPEFQNFVRGSHKGGILKSEIMRRCYRTPASILVAAHAIGMGFLRPTGMLAGLTRKEDWNSLGYQVEGDFRKKNEPIKLHRPPENSPSPLPELWKGPLLEFKTYSSRQEELAALAMNIRHNLEVDGLAPSRQIMVVILGERPKDLQTTVAQALMANGINIFIASGTKLNQINPNYPENDPDAFWHDGGVTISTVIRAKGNEAEMVYVVGLDEIAKHADDIGHRNQLFVAMTRARGWVNLSGVGNYPLYHELNNVVNSGNTFEFTHHQDKFLRDISEDADEN